MGARGSRDSGTRTRRSRLTSRQTPIPKFTNSAGVTGAIPITQTSRPLLMSS